MFVNLFNSIIIDTKKVRSVEINKVNNMYKVCISFSKEEGKTFLIPKDNFKTKEDVYEYITKLLNKGNKNDKEEVDRKISKEVFEQIKDIKELIKDAKSY
jgi:hypothetical protein